MLQVRFSILLYNVSAHASYVFYQQSRYNSNARQLPMIKLYKQKFINVSDVLSCSKKVNYVYQVLSI